MTYNTTDGDKQCVPNTRACEVKNRLVTILGERALVCPFCKSQLTDGEALSGKRTGCFLATLLFLFPPENPSRVSQCRHPCSPLVDDSLLGRSRLAMSLTDLGSVATTVPVVGLEKHTCH